MVENYLINDENYCGECPECKASWDKGEAVDLVGEATAKKLYGWTRDNKKHISKLIKIEPSDSQAWEGMNVTFQCPNCFVAWDSVTGNRTNKYQQMTVNSDVMKKFMERLKNSQ